MDNLQAQLKGGAITADQFNQKIKDQVAALQQLAASLDKTSPAYTKVIGLIEDLKKLLPDTTKEIDNTTKEIDNLWQTIGKDMQQMAGFMTQDAQAFAQAAGRITESIGNIVQGLDDLKKAKTEAEKQAATAKITGGIAGGIGGLTDMLGGPPSGTGNSIFQAYWGVAGTVAEAVTSIPGLAQIGAALGAFFNTVVGDLSNGRAQVAKEVDKLREQFTLLDPGKIVVTHRVSRGGILGWLGFTKEAIDQAATNIKLAMAEAIQSGMMSGFESAVKQYLITGKWGDLTKTIKSALLEGLIQGWLQSKVFEKMFGPYLEAYINNPTQANANAVLNQIPKFKSFWEQVRSQFGGFFNDLQDQVDQTVNAVQQAYYSLPDAKLSLYGTPQWVNSLTQAGNEISDAAGTFKTWANKLLNDGITVRGQSSPLSGQSVRAM